MTGMQRETDCTRNEGWAHRLCSGNCCWGTRRSGFTLHKLMKAADCMAQERVRAFHPLSPQDNPVVHGSKLNCLFPALWSLDDAQNSRRHRTLKTFQDAGSAAFLVIRCLYHPLVFPHQLCPPVPWEARTSRHLSSRAEASVTEKVWWIPPQGITSAASLGAPPVEWVGHHNLHFQRGQSHLQKDQNQNRWLLKSLGVHWKDWCRSWNSSTLATWCEELTHWKRLWCWERLRAGGEGDARGWDGWMASLPRWTWFG